MQPTHPGGPALPRSRNSRDRTTRAMLSRELGVLRKPEVLVANRSGHPVRPEGSRLSPVARVHTRLRFHTCTARSEGCERPASGFGSKDFGETDQEPGRWDEKGLVGDQDQDPAL